MFIKIKEKYYRPTIILTEASDGGAKGSGRSIEKFDMFQELSACKELFTKFGGHKMAAGLSLPEENVEILRQKLNENCTLSEGDFAQLQGNQTKELYQFIDDTARLLEKENDLICSYDRFHHYIWIDKYTKKEVYSV